MLVQKIKIILFTWPKTTTFYSYATKFFLVVSINPKQTFRLDKSIYK